MTVLATASIAQALVDQIKNAALSFTPKIVMIGDLSYWAEAADIMDDVPAIFVQPITLALSLGDVGGELWDQAPSFRVLLVDSFDEELDQNLVVKRMQRIEDLIDKAVIRTSGEDYRLDDSADVTVESVLPQQIEYTPPEHAAVAEQKMAGDTRRLYAAAFTLQVMARAER